MKILFSIVTAVLVLAVSGCAPQVDVEAERAAIRKFHDECLTKMLAGNVDCFAEDGQMLPLDATPIKGRSAIGELVSRMLEDPNFSVSHDVIDVDVFQSGDQAYVHYAYEITMSDHDGNPVAEQGKAIYILKKQPQVGWKILIDTWKADGESMSDALVKTEQMTAQAQVEEQNKALVRRILAEGDKKNLEVLDEVCASDYKVHFPGNAMPIGLEESKKLWQSFQAAFPDLTHTVEEIHADGDIVVVRESVRGTHEGEFSGIPPTGKKIEFSAVAIYRFSDGKCAESRTDADLLGLYQQLGMELRPKEGEND